MACRARGCSAKENQFLRYVFHELRVPLNTVTLAVEELSQRSKTVSGPSRELVEVAAAQVGTHQPGALALKPP